MTRPGFERRWLQKMRGMGGHHNVDIRTVSFQTSQDVYGFEGGNTPSDRQDGFFALEWHG